MQRWLKCVCIFLLHFHAFAVQFGDICEEKTLVGDVYINCVRVGNGPHNVLCMPGSLGKTFVFLRK